MIILLGLFAGLLVSARSQCNESSPDISSGNGTIGSPKYPNIDYNFSINCSWTFKIENFQVLNFTNLQRKLFFMLWNGTSNVKHCAGFLKIGNYSVDCFKKETKIRPSFIFYNANSCNVSSLKEVKKRKTFHFKETISVQFALNGSWGKTKENVGASEKNNYPRGFEMDYEYQDCPEELIINSTVTAPTTPPDPVSMVTVAIIVSSVVVVIVILLILVAVYVKRNAPAPEISEKTNISPPKTKSCSSPNEEHNAADLAKSEGQSEVYSAVIQQTSEDATTRKTTVHFRPEEQQPNDLQTGEVIDNILYIPSSRTGSVSSFESDE